MCVCVCVCETKRAGGLRNEEKRGQHCAAEWRKRKKKEESGCVWLCQTVLHGNVLFSVRHKNNENHLLDSLILL